MTGLRRFVKQNLLNFLVIFTAFLVLFFSYSNSRKVRQELSTTKAELQEKQERSFAQLDSKLERLENQTLKLKEQGYVEADDFSDVSKRVLEATVLVANSKETAQLSPSGEVITIKEENVKGGGGTGFFINSDGMVATAKHVVEAIGQDNLVVRLPSSGKQYQAQVIASHDKSDVAILKINASNTPFVEVGYYENTQVGEDIGFVGFALEAGLQKPLIHRGIISAKGVDLSGEKIVTINAFVNKGNSGGPVFSAKTGRVLGVLSARQRDVASNQFISLPPGYSSGFSLGGVDPLKLSVDLYNQTLGVVGDIAQVGIGIAYPMDTVEGIK